VIAAVIVVFFCSSISSSSSCCVVCCQLAVTAVSTLQILISAFDTSINISLCWRYICLLLFIFLVYIRNWYKSVLLCEILLKTVHLLMFVYADSEDRSVKDWHHIDYI